MALVPTASANTPFISKSGDHSCFVFRAEGFGLDLWSSGQGMAGGLVVNTSHGDLADRSLARAFDPAAH